MRTIGEIQPLRQLLACWRKTGETVALVPTMGNLHAGHLALVARGRQLAARVVVSIFVNPVQFDRADDLAAYPRTPEADREKLTAAGVDCLFIPEAEAIYPGGGLATRVVVPEISEILEGASRPGHFTGVATVVCKLFNLIQPDLALFGEKDFQQLLLIRRLAAELNFPVAIEALPTVREADGLALSSRNSRLNPTERKQAPGLYQTLQELAADLARGRQDYPLLRQKALHKLIKLGFRPDYVEIRRRSDLAEPTGEHQLIILAAAWLGRVRLIDNLMVE